MFIIDIMCGGGGGGVLDALYLSVHNVVIVPLIYIIDNVL